MSDYKSSGRIANELYALTETVEEGNRCVCVAPEIWIEGDDTLLWPPGPANRKNPILPQPNWIRHKCTILKRNIATFDEALYLEKIYSMHNDSNSFRAAETKKQLKRAHPINENLNFKADLINLNSMIGEIDGSVEQAKIPKKTGNPDIENVNVRSQPRSKYHDQCPQNDKKKMLSGNSNLVKNQNLKVGTVKKSIPPLKAFNPKNLNDKDKEKPAPRYINYLKSGIKSTQGKICEPPKKSTASATLTKEHFLMQNGIAENDFQERLMSVGSNSPKHSDTPSVAQNLEQFQGQGNDEQLSKRYEVGNEEQLSKGYEVTNSRPQFMPAASNGNLNDVRRNPRTASVVDNILPIPAMNSTPILTDFGFQSTVVQCLDDIKQFCQQSEVKRVHFEARMQTQWDLFVKKVSKGGGIGGQNETQIEDYDDFEDLDNLFPKKREIDVEEFEVNIRRDFVFRRRLNSKMDLLGGASPNAAVRARMKYLFTDKVLDKYTWRGTAELAAFKDFKALNSLIYNNVCSNFPKVKYPKDQYGKYMVQWIKHSTTRQRTVVYSYPNRTPQVESRDEANGDDDNDEYHFEEDEGDDFP